LFHEKVEQFQEIKIIEQIGFGLVELIENGKINSTEMTELLKKYINPMIASDIDYLVLGCSHYPYLIQQLKKLLPKNIKIIDSGEAVAIQTKKILIEKIGLRESNQASTQLFYTNSDPKVLQELLGRKYLAILKEF
jgi:glutamate racemase